jgi:outer membrane protein assembly factor BamB/tetratricopeptide (TPR) repeat protein
LKLSFQPWFYNMAQVEHDYRVDALLKRADELSATGDYRAAMKLYHEVIDRFPDDLWRVQADGVFIPSGYYAQRQLLRMPREQLLYYRTLHDAEARAIFERAVKYYSPLDFAVVAERYLATSYGPRALWELGNAALDQQAFAKALFYFEQVRDYGGAHDIAPDELALRLAVCYRRLGRDAAYAEARKQASAGALLSALDQQRFEKPPYFRQVREPGCVALGDYDLWPEPTEPVGRSQFVWSQPLPQPQREWFVRALPWVAGNSIYYLHNNVLYCRSLLSGKLNWTYMPGGTMDWFDTINWEHAAQFRTSPLYHPQADVLIHDGLVFASVVKEGPSLVAVDQITGELRWARGAFTGAGEAQRNVRYLAAPAPGPQVVYAPYVDEDIAGASHLSSTVGVQCLQSRTGRLIWSRDVCSLTPAQFSISSRVRRIRVFGSQPTAKDGIVYHNTNAGVVAALDALSGRILWVTRYPHDADAHDLLKTINDHLWLSRPPLVYQGRVYVTPADSDRLLCLEAATGKVVWSAQRRDLRGGYTMVGVNAEGDLVIAGTAGLIAMDPATGRKAWDRPTSPADTTARIPNASEVRCLPIMTRGNHIYFSGNYWGGTHCEQFWDMTAKKTLAERWFYETGNTRTLTVHNERVERAATEAGKEVNPADLVHNTTDPFTMYHRMTFERYGTLFELEVSPRAVSLWYDRERVLSAVQADASPQGRFRLAELHEMRGEPQTAIDLCERALVALPADPTPLRTEINRQLFRLYRHQAESALRSGDLTAAEKLGERMASACTSSQDEILTILALAEVYEKQGRWSDAAAALHGAIKHYGPVKFALPEVMAGDTAALRAKGMALIKNLQGRAPSDYYGQELGLAVLAAQASLDHYFSILSPLDLQMQVQAGPFAGRWLQRLLAEGPPEFRKQYEAGAADEFAQTSDEATTLALVDEYPGTQAAQKALDGLIAQAVQLPEPDRRIALWRLNEVGRSNGLKPPDAMSKVCDIRVPNVPAVPLADGYRTAATTLDLDANTLLMLLAPGGGAEATDPHAFIGLRAKRINANKFGLIAWDLPQNRQRWIVDNVRLKDKGEEEGFTKYYVHKGKVIVHGWYDVLAFSLADGGLVWRTQAPHGFRILDSACADDVIVLTASTRTLALHLDTGRLLWEANETGGAYAPPILRDNLLVTVRRNPGGVAFRDLGTGRLISLLPLPTLSEATANPAVTWDEPGVPIADSGDSLVVTDGWDYIVVDLPSRSIRWQKRIANLDRGVFREGTRSASFRFWAEADTFIALQPDYDSVALTAYNLGDGQERWNISEVKTPGVLHDLVMGPDAVYGLHQWSDDPASLYMLGYGLADGQLRYRQVQRGLTQPQAWVCGRLRGERYVVRYSDQQKRNLAVVEAATGKVLEQVEVQGFGQWGQYGQVSYAIQGPYLAVLSDKTLTVASPDDK